VPGLSRLTASAGDHNIRANNSCENRTHTPDAVPALRLPGGRSWSSRRADADTDDREMMAGALFAIGIAMILYGFWTLAAGLFRYWKRKQGYE
jgi:hypothetical protein